MKYRLLDILRCPSCGGTLAMKTFEEMRAAAGFQDIRQGLLECTACHSPFPIVHSVPRMLPNAFASFPEFLETWKDRLDPRTLTTAESQTGKELGKEYRQVVKHFQSQWQHWGRHGRSFGKDVQGCLDFLRWSMIPKAAGKDFFEQKRILDAGCGHGKYVMALSESTSEIVGMDITRAIDLCEDLVGGKANVHLVQADVIHPPFAPGSFDYVFSEGVIHHTPDTRQAFRSLAALPKPGGVYSVWVYPFRAGWWEVLQGFLRSITTRLPRPLLRALCYIPVPLLSVSKLKAYSGTSLKNSSWSECAQVVYDFYGPKYQTHHTEAEVMEWFNQEHYGQLEAGPDPTSVTGIRL